ncbi:hypothetical protein [Gaetbulibacter saemankumensis]|uniref:hypothetical protein n=1 Tax=Gaetbulibacter saemankumensis TaxID=311208 RepID=UPI0003F92E94|nr:hypothetical protein [Gaetbulibacter saemankumensis]
MLDKIKLSIWDILTFFTTGTILIGNILLYFPELFSHELEKLSLIKSDVILLVVFIIISYLVGILFEPICNKFFWLINKIIEPKSIKSLQQESNLLEATVKSMIEEKFNFKNAPLDYFQIARLNAIQNGKPNNFMAFLTKYGFYRSITIILLINAITLNIYKIYHCDYNLLVFFYTIALLIVFYLCFVRAKEFYFYSGNEIFRNYILNN